jgi:hypothetical protein
MPGSLTSVALFRFDGERCPLTARDPAEGSARPPQIFRSD